MGLLNDLFTTEDLAPQPDMCACADCGWKGEVANCELHEESEGWEHPSYWVHLCPVCEDGGCIDDYWFSEDENNSA